MSRKRNTVPIEGINNRELEMNYCVPEFEMDDEYPTSTSSISKQKAEDDIMELLWQDGQVVTQSQTQRSHHKSPATNTPSQPPPPQPPPPENAQLYIAEDEMATWLHYPLEDIYSDLLYPTSTPPQPAPPQPTPPPPPWLSSPTLPRPSQPVQSLNPTPPPAKPPVPPPRNFPLFSRLRGRAPAPAPSTDLTVMDSNKPSVQQTKSVGEAMSRAPPSSSDRSRVGGSCDMTVTSSTSGSGSSDGGAAAADATDGGERKQEVVAKDRKRKGRETDEVTATAAAAAAATTTECHTEDVENESADEKKHSRGSAAKRSRAAEVHNLSERRRRDRINEKMRALQELIPRCNKSDKASMLDEAIEYLKSLQVQVQMMSMGCGMVPMMYPGMQQQYMPGMGMAIGMGMGMDMNRPMISFPGTAPASALPTTPGGAVVFTTPAATGAPHLAPRFPVQPFPMHPLPHQPAFPRLQASNQPDPIRSPVPLQSYSIPQLANMADPYQQYLALQQMQMQMQMQQNLSVSQPGSSKPSLSKPSTSMSEDEFDDNQCG